MALDGTLTHRKTRRLALRLGICPPLALGLMEALWAVTREFARRGDIGRLSNADIAMEMFYDGCPDRLVDAMVQEKLLDESADHRLLIHDWHEHSDNTTDAWVTRTAPHTYASGVPGRGTKLSRAERDAVAISIAQSGADLNVAEPEIVASDIPAPPAPVAPKPKERRTKAHNGAVGGLPEPEPEPVPEPEVKTLAPAKPPPAVRDKRHVPFRDSILAWWRAVNSRVPMPWDGSEGRRLDELLRAMPTLSLDQFEQCLWSRGQSEVVLTERPRAWLGSITNYAGGQLDRFGKPVPAPVWQPGMPYPDRTPEDLERAAEDLHASCRSAENGNFAVPAGIVRQMVELERRRPDIQAIDWQKVVIEEERQSA